jgi:hypothetical protein
MPPHLQLISGSLNLLDEKPFLRKSGSILSSEHLVWEPIERVLRNRTVLSSAENEAYRGILTGEHPVFASVVQV